MLDGGQLLVKSAAFPNQNAWVFVYQRERYLSKLVRKFSLDFRTGTNAGNSMQLSQTLSLMFITWGTLFGSIQAQDTLTINLPDVNILADKVTRGDADTYGLGDWSCKFEVELLDDAKIKLKGVISFAEKANDYTTIVGKYEQVIAVKALEPYAYFRLRMETAEGRVSGPNIGARGYRWFSGEGLIQKARIQTDTFGDDTGRIGGTIRFHPLIIVAQREYAALEVR